MKKNKKYYEDEFLKFWDKCKDIAEDELIKENMCISTYINDTTNEIFEETANAEQVIGYYIYWYDDDALITWLENTNRRRTKNVEFTEQDRIVDAELKRLFKEYVVNNQ